VLTHTGDRPCATSIENFVKFAYVVPQICPQTDGQTDMLIALLLSSAGGGRVI